jgi:hypothetical protein
MIATSSAQNSGWYRSGPVQSEHLLQQAASNVDRDLLGLDTEELELLGKSWTFAELGSFIDEVDKTIKRKVRGDTYERARSLLLTISDFANHFGGLIKSMPPNSQYSMTLGALAVLINVSDVHCFR